MSATIDIRAYVVGFGDCILLSLPEGTKKKRHVLIDFGRAPNDAVSLERFPAIAEDIHERCNGHLDLIVVTHEHLDHLEGFYRERAIFDTMTVDQVWMSLPSDPNYYRDYPKAKPAKKLREAIGAFAAHAAAKGIAFHPAFQSLIENNLSNKDRIDYLRKLGKKKPMYLSRGSSVASWSSSIKIRVLAPEKDMSVYYGKSAQAHALAASFAASFTVAPGLGDDGFQWDFKSVPRAKSDELGGFSATDFDRLRRAIREDGVAAARFIDKAQNNTSLCLLIEVAGKRLLLPGDAELESWEQIRKHCKADLAKPVDFLKVAHHGSHNGTPTDALDDLLPVARAKKAKILVSTKKNVYGTKNPVPDESLMTDLKRRCTELVTTDGAVGTYVDLSL